MCGISGWVRPAGLALGEVVEMTRRVAHRGPDGEGFWWWDGTSETGHVGDAMQAATVGKPVVAALGHRRLAIIDLSEAGLQPMPSPDRRHWLVYNGEIYNYLELRAELRSRGYVFRTETDTEVILAAYDHWGTECFARFNGMWGLALVDLRRRSLVLSRDRLGIKPLYVWQGDGGVAFASEIKQFFALAPVRPRADMRAVVEYVSTGHEHPPATFFSDIKALAPGTWCEVPLDRPEPRDPQPYWFPEGLEVEAVAEPEAQARTRTLFEDAVRLRLRADVPVGVCLSGGLDSSAIYGQVQHLKNGSQATTYAFSAAYDETRFNEQPYVDIVLRDFGGQGFSTHTTADDFLADCDRFIYQHDEPPGSLTHYAAWAVMRLARTHDVPVLLNGQGGDELFSGYWPAYYLYLRRMLRLAPWQVARHVLGALTPRGNPEFVRQVLPHLRKYRHRRASRNTNLLAETWHRQSNGTDWSVAAQGLTPVQYRLAEIRQVHLPRLLKWDDRNAMAFSIEGRYPFLDHRLVEWAVTLPPEMNLWRGWNKLLLRQSLQDVLPPEIQWRQSKIGFVTPQSTWISTTLRPMLEAWAHHPSPSLSEVVDTEQLGKLARQLFDAQEVHILDERHILLIRLFFLDRWFDVFKVELDESALA